MSKIDDLKKEYSDLREKTREIDAQRRAVSLKIRAVLQAIAYERFSIREGCVVRVLLRGKEAEALVESVSLSSVDCSNIKPWADGRLRRKDGKWSERVQCLYSDWTIISQPEDEVGSNQEEAA